MSALIDGRPAGLSAYFRPGNLFTLTLTWPTSTLSGRTFTADLGGNALTVDISGDVMTITASVAITTSLGEGAHAFTLTETTSGSQDIIVGTWVGDQYGAETQATSVTVAATAGDVTVSIVAVSAVSTLVVTQTADVGTDLTVGGDASIAGTLAITETASVSSDLSVGGNASVTGTANVSGNASVGGDITITGQILTGSLSGAATFGGIEREARCFPAGELLSPTGQVNFGSGVPRINMPASITTDIYAVIEVEEWWLDSTIGVYFEWVNDHSTTGDVRWDCEFREYPIAVTDMAGGGSLRASKSFTQSSPPADYSTTGIFASVSGGIPITFDPGPFASFYVLRISRYGAHAEDTLAGPVGFIATNMTRGQ